MLGEGEEEKRRRATSIREKDKGEREARKGVKTPGKGGLSMREAVGDDATQMRRAPHCHPRSERRGSGSREHGHVVVLGRAAALAVLHGAIRGESGRVPEANWVLNT